VIPNARSGSIRWPRLTAAAIVILVTTSGCGAPPSDAVAPGVSAAVMAAVAAGWDRALAEWRRDLDAWRDAGAAPAASRPPAMALLHARRIDDQSRRVDAFARALATHEARLRMVQATGRRPPIGLSASVADEHGELKSAYDMLAAAQLSLDDERDEIAGATP